MRVARAGDPVSRRLVRRLDGPIGHRIRSSRNARASLPTLPLISESGAASEAFADTGEAIRRASGFGDTRLAQSDSSNAHQVKRADSWALGEIQPCASEGALHAGELGTGRGSVRVRALGPAPFQNLSRGTGLPRFDASSVEECDFESTAGRTTGASLRLLRNLLRAARTLHPR